MTRAVDNCRAKAAACRAAAEREALPKLRQVHLQAALSWERLADEAQRVLAFSYDLPDSAQHVRPSAVERELPQDDPVGPRHEEIGSQPIELAPQELRIALYTGDGHLRKLREIEVEVFRLAVTRYGHMAEAARRLGVGRSTLYRRLEQAR